MSSAALGSLIRHGLFAPIAMMAACSTPQSDIPSTRKPADAAPLDPRAVELEIFRQVNGYRRSRALPPLQSDAALTTAARQHSRNMAARKRISHSGFDRRFRQLRGTGITKLAENVAMSSGLADPVGSALSGWRRSSGHRRHMTTREFNLTGVGVAKSRDGAWYSTQLFGVRRGTGDAAANRRGHRDPHVPSESQFKFPIAGVGS